LIGGVSLVWASWSIFGWPRQNTLMIFEGHQRSEDKRHTFSFKHNSEFILQKPLGFKGPFVCDRANSLLCVLLMF